MYSIHVFKWLTFLKTITPSQQFCGRNTLSVGFYILRQIRNLGGISLEMSICLAPPPKNYTCTVYQCMGKIPYFVRHNLPENYLESLSKIKYCPHDLKFLKIFCQNRLRTSRLQVFLIENASIVWYMCCRF